MIIFKNILILFTAMLPLRLISRTILISPGATIQSFINNARKGDTLFLQKGIYYPSATLIINKKIVLTSKGDAILDGRKKIEIMVVQADSVEISHIHFRNSGTSGYNDIAALRLMQSGQHLITQNIFENCFFGIYGQHIHHSKIFNNSLRSSGISELQSANGIHCWKSDHLQIENNSITGHRDGIYFEFVTESMISANYSHGNLRYGLHFMFSSNNTYIKNQFINNGAGVAVMYSHGINMQQNKFAKNWGTAAYGILMKDITDSKVIHNQFDQNTISIYMEGSNRIHMEQNSFTRNGWGIKIQSSCTDNTIRLNNFSGNTFDVATNGSLQLNDFTGNYWDKYEGYDLNRNNKGDVPYHPVSIFSMIVERNPAMLMMFRSFIVSLMDKSEKIFPGITPEGLVDNEPYMRPFHFK